MKLLRNKLLFCALLISSVAFSQQLAPSIVWQKSLGGSQDDVANSVVATTDGGFIVVGSSKSNDGDVSGHHGATTTTDAWVVKISATGTIEWQRSLGGTQNDEFRNVILTPDGGYICHGFTNSNDGDVVGQHGSADLWLVKLDRYGNIVWKRCYGGSGNEAPNVQYGTLGSIRYINGYYYMIGATGSNDGDVSGNHLGNGIADVWVVKLDLSGNIISKRCFGGTQTDAGFDIAAAEPGYLLMAINCDSGDGDFGVAGGNPPRGMFVKIDTNYVIKSQSSFNRENPNVIIPNGANNYFWGGNINNCYPNNPNNGVRIGKLTNNPGSGYSSSTLTSFATCQTNFSLPNYNYQLYSASSIMATGTGDVLFAGATTDTVGNDHGGYDGIVSGIKSTGTVAWRKLIGGSGTDLLKGIAPISETEFLVVGSSTSNNGDVSGNHGGIDCWIVKLGQINKIKGTAFLDYNLNGAKDVNEPVVNNLLVESQKGVIKAGSLTYNGIFSNSVDTGTYITKVITPYTYYTPVPATQASTFTAYNSVDSFGFALQPIPGKRDYKISLFPTSAARPGFNSGYSITYSNVGTDTLINRQVRMIKDSRQSFVSASVAPLSVVADTITWNIAHLDPRQGGTIAVQLFTAAPPVVNYNDTLRLSAIIDSTGDLTPANNIAKLKNPVFGSFDPNDKMENLGGTLQISELPGELTYTIRFQNTGNDTAFRVIIRDTLDANLDWSTIQMTGASHNYEMNISNGNILTWTFPNIQLADSNHNEAASHGYITYSIVPKQTLVVGDIIRNSASIYFDFNLPVKTNTQVTTVKAVSVAQPSVSGVANNYCSTQGVQKGKINNLPANGSGVTATAKLDGNAIAIAADSTFSFDVSALAAGQHSIVVTYTNGSETKSSTNNFTVTAAVTPDVNVSANATTLANLNDPLTVTASNAAGGGSTPLYAFAKDRNFTTLWQAESASNVFNTTGNSLNTGDNWIYVRMKTSSTCFTTLYNIDSIKITLSLPAPNIPAVTGIKANYCNNEGVQKAKITNYPAAGTGTTVTAKLNGSVIPIVMTDTSFTFDVANLGGNNVIDVSYANPTATRTTTINFAVTVAVAPQVDLTASSTTVKDGQVSLTATQLAGGGTPSYTFATDRNFTNIIRPESPNGIVTLNVSSLKLGNTQFFVLMKTTATCSTKPTATDSITITKISATGLVDPDYPNQTISANPNPFRNQLVLYGLNASKTYTAVLYDQQGHLINKTKVSGRTSQTWNVPGLKAGTYMLRIYDETRGRVIGVIEVVKQ